MRIFSYGGGVQSTAALVLAGQRRIDFPVFVFANTGDDSENPDTLAYVAATAAPYAKEHGIELVTLDRTRKDGTVRTLYGDMTTMQNRRVPIPVRLANGAPGNRSCTSEYKIDVVSRWLKKRGATKDEPATLGMGISIDEFQRMRTDDPRYPHIHKEYPLIDLRLSRADCVAIIERAGLPVPPKSACWFCPFKRVDQWAELRRDKPELFERAVALEKLINERRHVRGHDDLYLSRALKPLDRLFGDTHQMTFDDAPGVCSGDVCMT